VYVTEYRKEATLMASSTVSRRRHRTVLGARRNRPGWDSDGTAKTNSTRAKILHCAGSRCTSECP